MNAMPRRPVRSTRRQTGVIPVWRRVAAWLALWVVLSGALGGLAPAQAQSSALGSVVCTAAGMTVIAAQDDDTLGRDMPRTALCLFCLPLLHGGALAPQMAEPAFFPSSALGSVVRPDAAVRPVADPHRSASAPRAPPLSARS